jgi:hypothetical protein
MKNRKRILNYLIKHKGSCLAGKINCQDCPIYYYSINSYCLPKIALVRARRELKKDESISK